MTRFYIIFFLFTSFFAKSQSLSKKEFKNTKWFSENKDSLFFRKDTIQLIKYTNKSEQQPNKHQIQYDESEYDYLNDNVYVVLEFLKNKDFFFAENNWSFTKAYLKGILFWKYDENLKVISIFERQKLKYKLKVLSTREIEIESKKSKKMLKTIELTVVKLR